MSLVLVFVIFVVSCLVAVASGGYLFVKLNLVSEVPELIALAESFASKSGSEKMDWVCEQLYSKVPTIFKKVLTLEALRLMAQSIFDNVKTYATKYINKLESEE